MSEKVDDVASGENHQVSSGDLKPTEEPSGQPANRPEGSGSGKVDYASYQKLLSEKKKLQKEFDRIKQDSEKQKNQELINQQRYKELYESVQTEKSKLEEKVMEHETRWQDAIKINAFNETLGETKRIDSKYLGFIDTSKILIDADTNKVDPVSVQKEVERITTVYPEIVRSTVTTTLPNAAPNSRGTLSYQEWLKLPPAEMKRRRKELKD